MRYFPPHCYCNLSSLLRLVMTQSEFALLYNVYHKVSATKLQNKALAFFVSIMEKPFSIFLFSCLLQCQIIKTGQRLCSIIFRMISGLRDTKPMIF